ncbi:hypothetical protein J7L05_10770 [bacterium]|nr:hypothetical protein [bacterium]
MILKRNAIKKLFQRFAIIPPLALLILLFSTADANAGERYAVLMQNVGVGLVNRLEKVLLEDYHFPAENVSYYRCLDEDGKEISGAMLAESVLSKLDELSCELQPGDKLIIAFLCHMKSGFCVNASLTYKELEDALAIFDDDVDIILFMEGCHSAGALKVVESADALITSAETGEICYGGFMRFWINAIDPKHEAYKNADTDNNGFVTVGEAYEYARDEKKLAKWYRDLDDKVWPFPDFYPTPTALFQDGGESLTLCENYYRF